MRTLLTQVSQYVEENIDVFHQKRLDSISKLKLKTVLKKKNPYLFKTKYFTTYNQIVKALLDAFVSSNEETIFGDWLEGLAIFVNHQVYKGRKSGIKGIDLEFDKESIRYIVSIKSGPNWGNSSQIAKMKNDFNSAKRTLRTSNSNLNIVAVNGCCYGQDRRPDKGEYFKYCGQQFWHFISNEPNLYLDIIEPLGKNAKIKNDEFQMMYSTLINKFSVEFAHEFSTDSHEIDWEKLLKFNSAIYR